MVVSLMSTGAAGYDAPTTSGQYWRKLDDH
jgi:hypothetical protein